MINVVSPVYGTTHAKSTLIQDCRNLILGNGKTPLIMVRRAGNDSLPEELQTGANVVIDISPGAGQEWCVEADEIHFFASFKGKAMFVTIPIDDVLTIYDREDRLGLLFGTTSDPDLTHLETPELPDSEYVLVLGCQGLTEDETLWDTPRDQAQTKDLRDMLKTSSRRH